MARCTDRPAITMAVDLGRKATKQKNKCVQNSYRSVSYLLTHKMYIYSNKKVTSDFHGTVSINPVKMSQQK